MFDTFNIQSSILNCQFLQSSGWGELLVDPLLNWCPLRSHRCSLWFSALLCCSCIAGVFHGWSCFSTCSGLGGMPQLTQAHHQSHQHYRFLWICTTLSVQCPHLHFCCGATLSSLWQNYYLLTEPWSLSSTRDVGGSVSLLHHTGANGRSDWALFCFLFYSVLFPPLCPSHCAAGSP